MLTKAEAARMIAEFKKCFFRSDLNMDVERVVGMFTKEDAE